METPLIYVFNVVYLKYRSVKFITICNLNLNHKTLTAEKLISEEKKNHQPEKKKQLFNYARNVHVLRHTL